jgi:hypothetical protein
MQTTKHICLTSILLLGISATKAQLRNPSLDVKAQQNAIATKDEKVSIQMQNLLTVEKIDLPFYNIPTVTLTDLQTATLNNYTLQDKIILEHSFTPIVTVGFEQKKPIAYIQIPNYINTNGQVQKLLSYKLNVTQGAEIKKTRGKRTYAANSILASGKWQKIAISQTGIHKIDYDFVKNTLGVNPESINTTLIKICGNGGGMLSENNEVLPLDDVQQTAIQLVGMTDNKWDPSDYILFYATGAHAIIKDSVNQKFSHQFNLYSNQSHYFINFDTGAGQRITSQGALPTANKSINIFNEYVFHENDSVNLGSVGKIWWGDVLGNKIGYPTTKTFNFNLPNIVADSNISIITSLGNKSINTNANLKLNASILNNGSVTVQQSFDNFITYTGSQQYAPILSSVQNLHTIKGAGSALRLDMQYLCSEDQATGYTNFIGINAYRQLVFTGSQMAFRYWPTVGNGNVVSYKLNAPASTTVWDVTNPQIPVIMNTSNAGGVTEVIQNANNLHEFIAFDNTQFFKPAFVANIPNQNLHSAPFADFLIITHPSFKTQAQNLANLHATKENMRTFVATTEEIYNEFGSGTQDISALRNFAKMFFDRATNATDLPKYLLMFGDASFDYKDRIKGNTNFVPSRESDESINKFETYVSDDFFAILDDNKNINNPNIANTLDLGVGRFVCKDADEANVLVSKVANYYSNNTLGDWRLNQTFCADDRDYAQHAIDAEIMSKAAAQNQPNFNLYKIYVDAFPIFSTPAGNRAPQAKQAIDAQLFNGCLIVNYNGHGGTSGWCEERILNTADVGTFNNLDKMPIFITATCDFAPYNNPGDKSCGEQLFLHKRGGAIALLTTTAVVFQNQNQIMNSDYWKEGFKPMANGKMPRLGDALRLSKNKTYVTPNPFDNYTNYRKFVLLGDPALMPAFTKDKVVLDSVNGVAITGSIDTLRALNAYTLSGHVSDANTNTLLSDFNGTVSISIFDKKKSLNTLQNVPESSKINYELQNAIVFKGKASVTNGKWNVYFIVPKDIDYSFGSAKISMYAQNGVTDAAGNESTLVKIGGAGSGNITDTKGPEIKPFMNNNKFINGGITAPNSTLYVELFDEIGINTSGSSVGHDLVAYLDDNIKDQIILNNFYEGAKDNYKSGIVRYPFKNLSEGKHTLTVKAWDVANNSNTASVDFVVSNTNTAKLDRLMNIPNPFSTSTHFTFEHNFPNEPLYVTIQIFTSGGQVVKTIQQYIQSEGSRVTDIHWDGKDQLGDKLARGVYLYRVYYKTITGISISKYEKLVIL